MSHRFSRRSGRAEGSGSSVTEVPGGDEIVPLGGGDLASFIEPPG
jgi:hypothetical protein